MILESLLGTLDTQNGLSLTLTAFTPGQLLITTVISPVFLPLAIFLTLLASIIGTAVVSILTDNVAEFADVWL